MTMLNKNLFANLARASAQITFQVFLTFLLVQNTYAIEISWDAPTRYTDGTPLTDLIAYEIQISRQRNVYDSTTVVADFKVDALENTFRVDSLPTGILFVRIFAIRSNGTRSLPSKEFAFKTAPPPTPTQNIIPTPIGPVPTSNPTPAPTRKSDNDFNRLKPTSNHIAYDFNGDGRSDIPYWTRTSFSVALSNEQGLGKGDLFSHMMSEAKFKGFGRPQGSAIYTAITLAKNKARFIWKSTTLEGKTIPFAIFGSTGDTPIIGCHGSDGVLMPTVVTKKSILQYIESDGKKKSFRLPKETSKVVCLLNADGTSHFIVTIRKTKAQKVFALDNNGKKIFQSLLIPKDLAKGNIFLYQDFSAGSSRLGIALTQKSTLILADYASGKWTKNNLTALNGLVQEVIELWNAPHRWLGLRMSTKKIVFIQEQENRGATHVESWSLPQHTQNE